MADEAFDVPAEGTVEYKYFRVDPGFKEDKWVKVAECLPDNRLVVHHIHRLHQAARGAAKGIEAFGHLTGYAPARAACAARGMAKFAAGRLKLVFQLHYTPNGTPQKDRSSVRSSSRIPRT